MPSQQLEHHEIVNQEQKFPLVVVCDNISSAENVGMTFRISEAMGVECIYLCKNTPGPAHKKVKKTSRSTEKYLKYQSAPDTAQLLEKLKCEGYTTVALEVTNNSIALSKADFRALKKIALVIGNEQHGVSAEVLNRIDQSVEITMYGKNTSINVVNSLSIALYEISKQLQNI